MLACQPLYTNPTRLSLTGLRSEFWCLGCQAYSREISKIILYDLLEAKPVRPQRQGRPVRQASRAETRPPTARRASGAGTTSSSATGDGPGLALTPSGVVRYCGQPRPGRAAGQTSGRSAAPTFGGTVTN